MHPQALLTFSCGLRSDPFSIRQGHGCLSLEQSCPHASHELDIMAKYAWVQAQVSYCENVQYRTVPFPFIIKDRDPRSKGFVTVTTDKTNELILILADQ